MLLNSKVVILSFIIWFACFSGNYIFLGVGIYPPLLLALFGYTTLLLLNKRLPKFIMTFFIISMTFVILFSMSFLYNDISINIFSIELKYVFKSLTIPLGVSLLVFHYMKKYNFDSKQIALSIILIIFFQSSIVILQLVSVSFRDWFFSFINLAPEWEYFVKIGHFRTVGLSGLSIYDTAVAYTLIFGMTIPLLNSINKKLITIWFLSYILIFLLILLSGRSGLIIFFVLTVFILLNTHNKKIVYTGFLIVSLLTIFSILYFVENEIIELLAQFAFEFFLSSQGSLESASTNDFLENHLFFPWNVNPLLGNGIWAMPSISNEIKYEYSTDSGYLLSLISIGISGLLLSLLLTFFMFKGYEFSYFNHFKPNIASLFIKLIIGLLIFLLVLKGPLFFSEKFMSVLLMVFTFNYYLRMRSRELKI